MINSIPSHKLPSSTSPLRIFTNVKSALTSTGFIEVTLSNNAFNIASNTLPLCVLYDQSTIGFPYLTQCSYDFLNKKYTLNCLNAISVVGRYLIEITNLQQDLALEGVNFPSDTSRVSLKVTINSATTSQISEDSTFLAPQARKSFFFYSLI